MIDLFAGCGGMTCGFVAEGFTPTLAVEWDLHAAATYAANHGEEHTLWRDIGTVRASEIPRADIVIGGPPCQGFSNLGSKDVNDPRNKLWREYLRVVRQADPLVFVIENVDRFMRTPEFDLSARRGRPRQPLALSPAVRPPQRRRLRGRSAQDPHDRHRIAHRRDLSSATDPCPQSHNTSSQEVEGNPHPHRQSPRNTGIRASAGFHGGVLRRASPRCL